MILRLIFFIVVIGASVALPTWIFAIVAVAYALRYTAYELILIAGAIDAFYGGGGLVIPYYTLATALCLILIEWVKPRLSVYN